MVPNICSMPEPGLTHRTRMSACSSQQPQTVTLSSARHIGYPVQHAGAQPVQLSTGCDPTSCRQCWGLCGCWSPTPTLISSVLLGDAPAGWSSRAQESHTVASANVNRSTYRKPLLLLEEHGSGASITSAELKQQFSSEVSSRLSEMKGKVVKALSCVKEGSCWI